MQSIKLIAFKDVVLEIVGGSKTKEYREYKDFYTKRFSKLSVPFKLYLRGGYNKEALFVEVLIDKITIERPFINKWLAKLGFGQKFYVLNISKILNHNVNGN